MPDGALPDAPIVHPRIGEYPCADLCAAGVAYKLAGALLGELLLRRREHLVQLPLGPPAASVEPGQSAIGVAQGTQCWRGAGDGGERHL